MAAGEKSDSQNNLEKNLVTAAKGGSISFAGQSFRNTIRLVFVTMLTRYLGTEQYGVFKLVQLVADMTAGISMLGLSGGIKRFIALARKDKKQTMLAGVLQIGIFFPMIFGVFASILVGSQAELIAIYIFSKPALAAPLEIASLAIPILVIGKSLTAIAVGFKRVDYDVYANEFGANIIKLILYLIVIALGYGLFGVIAVYIASSLAIVIILLLFLRNIFSLKSLTQPAERPTREMMQFSLPLFFSLLLNQFGWRLETLVLGIYNIMANVGVFAAVLNISNIGNMAYVALRRISTPIFAELHSQNKIKELKGFYQVITKWALTFNLPFFMVIFLFSENLLLIFGENFTVGAQALTILAFGSLFNASSGSSGALINMSGYSRVTLYNSITYLIITLILDFTLIPKFGLLGAALASTGSLIAINSIRVIEVYALINRLLPVNRSLYKPLLAATISYFLTRFGSSYYLTDQPLIQLIVFSILMVGIYISLLIALKFSPEDRFVLSQLRFRKKDQKKSIPPKKD